VQDSRTEVNERVKREREREKELKVDGGGTLIRPLIKFKWCLIAN
jgi:hypothetical protein